MLGMPDEYHIANYFMARSIGGECVDFTPPIKLAHLFKHCADVASIFDRIGFQFVQPVGNGQIGTLPCSNGEITLSVQFESPLGENPRAQFKLSHRPTQGNCYNHFMALELEPDANGHVEARTVSTNGDPKNTTEFSPVVLGVVSSFLRAVQGPLAETLDPLLQKTYSIGLSGLNFPKV